MLNKLSGKQIKSEAIKNLHIAVNAAIDEGKLNINWASRYQAALESKKIVDYVQVIGKPIGAIDTGVVSLTIGDGLDQIATTPAATGNDYGVALEYPVVIRDSKTGTPIIVEDKEVWGTLEYVDPDYTLSFNIGSNSSPTPVNIPANTIIDFQYMQRFNLSTASEAFAANEKFVNGSVDVTEIQNLVQIAQDLYGPDYSLNNNGEAVLANSIFEEVSLLKANQETEGSIDYKINEQVLTVFASNNAGNGASLVGIEDVEGVFIATNVEGALVELEGRVDNLETTGNAEIIATHERELATTNEYFAQKTGENAFSSLEERFAEIETISDAQFKAIRTEFAEADTVLLEQSHFHISESQTGLTTANYVLTTQDVKETDFVAVYVNGLRQIPNSHYTIASAEGLITGITFAEDLVADDNVYIEFCIYK